MDRKIDGWRWRIRVGDARVKIEFLCDRDDAVADQAIALQGCRVVTAANLRGTGFVARDWVEEQLTGTIDGEQVTVSAKYAGLEGCLMAKAHAVRQRGLDRDCYDLVFVLIYNRAGGPGQAAERLQSGQFAADVTNARAVWREIEARFADASAFWPQSYAEQALLVEPEGDIAELRQDAVGAVAEFIAGLQLE